MGLTKMAQTKSMVRHQLRHQTAMELLSSHPCSATKGDDVQRRVRGCLNAGGLSMILKRPTISVARAVGPSAATVYEKRTGQDRWFQSNTRSIGSSVSGYATPLGSMVMSLTFQSGEDK